MILFPGDQVTATRDGHVITGVIENFTYDTEGWARGFANDIANVRTRNGDLIEVPAAGLALAAGETAALADLMDDASVMQAAHLTELARA